jgi:outer membrane protein OmpA-like peptidoglycan-associated protein
MKQPLRHLVSLGVLVALCATSPQPASAQPPGRIFGGVDVGVLEPVDGVASYISTGGVIAPFVGYKFFQDQDMRFNLGVMGQGQFFGAPADRCPGCIGEINFNDSYAFAGTVGPRLSLPVGPLEFYGTWGIGGIEGLNGHKSAIPEGAWGHGGGGGINYSLNENVSVGAFGRWFIWYEHPPAGPNNGGSLVGYVKYASAGLSVTLQQSPPAPPPPPAPVAAAPPPAPPPAAKKKIVLRGVNFDFNKYNIRPDAVPILEQACSLLKQEPNIDVVCKGYTDSIGSEAYNLKLSDRRANAVRDWLLKCGISPKRLSAKGYGKTDFVASNATPEGRAQNRRTELVVLGQ